LPKEVTVKVGKASKWVAVKNKFFLSILSPVKGAQGLELTVRRAADENESADDSSTWTQSAVVEEVSARMTFEGKVLGDGTSFSREYVYYVGPKKYAELKKLGKSYGEIMQFGFWSPLSRVLLTLLTFFYSVFNNYGVAIIMVTILVRMVFWPITHKSTESMKRMSAIQPEVKKLQAKYKDSPEKLNKATMALYKEHKVNPVAGCLPMLIQIPVFFALFTVLRSAVELRFADFLWIKDLSEQEGLLAGMIPIAGCLNILPLVMTGLTLWQQKITPSAGDPQQQKMMMFMPVMFLFLFYPMPSALVLYWTTSQLIALVQLLLQRRKKKGAVVATA
jgi:YidC/Oxa1 family membrane protein insertase